MDILISLLPLLVPLAFLLYYALHPVKCPDCGETLPLFYSPLKKTRRMWRAGGYLCARCGCETDTAGQKMTADTPMPPFPVRQWVLVGILLLVGLGLGRALWSGVSQAVAAQAVAAPPLVAPPQVITARPVVMPVVAFPQQAPLADPATEDNK